MYPKVYIGPMSKNIVDAAIELSKHYPIGFIPSRRQVDYASGYVNNWTTETLRQYVPSNIIIERDHGGPGQGAIRDGGNISFQTDAFYCQIIHVDPWKVYSNYTEGINKTAELLNMIHDLNTDVEFEIGTEEAIRPFTNVEFKSMLEYFKDTLASKLWAKISYVVVQSGTGLDLPNQRNTGTFNSARLKKQIDTALNNCKMIKEHNGDYLTAKEIQARFKLGVNAINIAPEIGQYETQALMDAGDAKFRREFFMTCLANVDMFKKWFAPKFFDPHKEPEKFVLTGGHYVISQLENCPDVYDTVKERLKKRLEDIYA